jgi:steroid 5-alpha reductase family enzyme
MQKLKENRLISFLIVTIVYAIATTVGVLVYKSLNLSWWLSLLIADIVATIVTFIFSVVFNNASVYDPYWSVQPPIILIAFAFGKKLTALGVLLIIAVCFWAIRLTANWAYTFKNLCHQDWRYTMLKETTGAFYPIINFVGIHLVPTLVVYGCILPAVYAVINSCTASVLSVIFICLSIGSATMQGIADIQMHKFRKNKNGAFIRNGLWKYSRHPNYLGEILMWWGVALAVVSSAPNAFYLILGAVANTLLFLVVSIPMADKRQSKKDGFNEYKSQTRALLPIKK